MRALQYNDLSLLLKRYPFQERVRTCFERSCHLLFGGNGYRDIDILRTSDLPWSLETFFLLSASVFPEYGTNMDTIKNDRRFKEMLNCIWEHTGRIVKNVHGAYSFVDYYLTATALSQFQYQQQTNILQYRYLYFFEYSNSTIDMKQRFFDFWNVNYIDFIVFDELIETFISCKVPSLKHKMNSYFKWLAEVRLPQCMESLTIERKDYVHKIQEYASGTNPDRYIYCVRPSYQYAFISWGEKLYFPLPHLLRQNTTSALLFRMTDTSVTSDGDKFRAAFGKHVLESYILDLVEQSKQYDFCSGEHAYTYNKNKVLSPDVIACKNGDIVLIDCKMSVPTCGLHMIMPEEFEARIKRMVKDVEQIYKQIQRYSCYHPFPSIPIPEADHIWGCIVFLEDSFIPRKLVYAEAAKVLDISADSHEYQWLCNHIKMFDLYKFEEAHIFNRSLLGTLKSMESERRPFDYVSISGSNEIVNDCYQKTAQRVEDANGKVFDEAQAAGVLSDT